MFIFKDGASEIVLRNWFHDTSFQPRIGYHGEDVIYRLDVAAPLAAEIQMSPLRGTALPGVGGPQAARAATAVLGDQAGFFCAALHAITAQVFSVAAGGCIENTAYWSASAM